MYYIDYVYKTDSLAESWNLELSLGQISPNEFEDRSNFDQFQQKMMGKVWKKYIYEGVRAMKLRKVEDLTKTNNVTLIFGKKPNLNKI